MLRRGVRLAVYLRRLRVQHVDRVFVQRVNVFLVRRHLCLNGARLARRDRAQRFRNGIVTLRSPRDVVHISELHGKYEGRSD